MPTLRELTNCRYLLQQHGAAGGSASIIAWWERRRLSYNIIVGAAGLITCAAFATAEATIGAATSHGTLLPDPPILVLVAVGLYGIMANICYTAGWLVEIALRRGAQQKWDDIGPALFKGGLMLSVILTLLPNALLYISITHGPGR